MRYNQRDKLIWGKVQVLRPPEYLEYTFTIKPMGEAVSLVKWWLEPVEGGTRLSLEHSGYLRGPQHLGWFWRWTRLGRAH